MDTAVFCWPSPKAYCPFPVPELYNDAELIWAKVSINGCKDLYISAYYRPHIDDMLSLEILDSTLNKLEGLHRNGIIWISGDFNAPYINWENMSIVDGTSYPRVHDRLLDIVLDHALSQLVDTPTRLNNVLDLFITNLPSLINSVNVIPGLSDHDIVMINSTIRLPILKQQPRLTLLYSRANWDAIKTELEGLLSSLTNIQHSDVEELWGRFRDTLLNAVYKYIPI